MIDGIVNNGPKEERPSVLEQLKRERPEPEVSRRPSRPAQERDME